MNEINTVILWYTNSLTQLYTVHFKFNDWWQFCLHKCAFTLDLLKNIIFVSLFYICDGCFSFNMLTALHLFGLNLMTNKSVRHWEQCKFKWNFLLKSTNTNKSKPIYHSAALFDNKSHFLASCLFSDNNLLLCDILSVTKFSPH